MPSSAPEHVNDVHLVGRLSALAVERELPSGDTVAAFRVIVERPDAERRPGGPRVDALGCSAFSASVRRSVMRWSPGDVIEVTGRLRRRFQRSPAGPTSQWDVEVKSARRLSRAALA